MHRKAIIAACWLTCFFALIFMAYEQGKSDAYREVTEYYKKATEELKKKAP